jgi:hypothetical protein
MFKILYVFRAVRESVTGPPRERQNSILKILEDDGEGSQQLINGWCLKPDESSQNSYTHYGVDFNIILKPIPKFPKRPLPSRTSTRMLHTFSYHLCYMSRPFHSPWLCYHTCEGSVRVESRLPIWCWHVPNAFFAIPYALNVGLFIYCSYEAHYRKRQIYT